MVDGNKFNEVANKVQRLFKFKIFYNNFIFASNWQTKTKMKCSSLFIAMFLFSVKDNVETVYLKKGSNFFNGHWWRIVVKKVYFWLELWSMEAKSNKLNIFANQDQQSAYMDNSISKYTQ